MSEISRDDVAHLARLARLHLTDAELDEYSAQIGGIVDHVAAIREVNTDNVEPMSHPTGGNDDPGADFTVASGMREDTVVPSLTAEQALDQAPKQHDSRFEVPQILGD